MNFAAKVISYVFHPLLMATYLFLLFTYTFPYALDPLPPDRKMNFVYVIFCITFVLPVLAIGLFRSMGLISDITIPLRRERVIPFMAIAIMYTVLTYLFYARTGVSLRDNVFRFMVIINTLLVVSTVVTIFYRVSVHSIAIWGMIGILWVLNLATEDGVLFYPLIAAIVIAGMVMSSRLYLHAHTHREVLVGAVLGLVTGFGGMILLF